MNRYRILFQTTLAAVLALLLTACDDNNRFVVKGDVADKATMNIRFVYAADGHLNNVLTASRDGEIEFVGQAPHGTVVEVLDNNYRVLCRFYAIDGDKDIGLYINPKSPAESKIDGNDVNDAWQDWKDSNIKVLKSRDNAAINAAVTRYVKQNPDNLLSAILLTSEYDARLDPEGAAMLLRTIRPEARPSWLTGYNTMHNYDEAEALKIKLLPMPYLSSGDSVATFNPKAKKRSLLAFTNEHSGRRDSIIPALRKIASRGDVALVDMRLETDTLTWKRSLRADSIKWTTGWGAGSVAMPGVDRLRIPSLPYFIVCDNTGKQLYRGRSVTAAVKAAGK